MTTASAQDGKKRYGLPSFAQEKIKIIRPVAFLEERLWAKLAKNLANYVVIFSILICTVEFLNNEF